MLELIVMLKEAAVARLRRLEEEGATAVEYALIVGLMTLTLMIGAVAFSRTVNRSYNSISSSISSAL